MVAPFESFDTSHLEYRQEWRTFFADTLQMEIRQGAELDIIVSLEERKAQRKAYEDQKEEELQQRRAAQLKLQAEKEAEQKAIEE